VVFFFLTKKAESSITKEVFMILLKGRDMKVTNRTSFGVCAVVRCSEGIGSGETVNIAPGEEGEVLGPIIDHMDSKSVRVMMHGEIVVHEGEDDPDSHRWQVLPGQQLSLSGEPSRTLIVRHFEESD
jgi:hypothetical protein